jgi:probable phosphomutase (TIGR03848 family)
VSLRVGTVLLVRHGLTAATGPVLTGWTPGVGLDERGRGQVTALRERIGRLPIAAIVASPLQRCQETAAALAAGRDGLTVSTEDRLGECRYGDWTGRELAKLARDPLWRVVQAHPSAVIFPGPEGEPLAQTQRRAVAAVRDWDGRLGPDAVWVAVSHGDVIKAVLADALGMHLDLFQRITVDPASLSAVRYTELRPFVLRLNDVGGDVSGLSPPKRRRGGRRRRAESDAPVGGGGGSTGAG